MKWQRGHQEAENHGQAETGRLQREIDDRKELVATRDQRIKDLEAELLQALAEYHNDQIKYPEQEFLAHFYRYYKICADDQTTLRAGTVTKRCIMLLEQLGIDENKWRVGKTLVFLKDYEIMDQLDKLREEKIVEYAMLLRNRTLISSPHISSRMCCNGTAELSLSRGSHPAFA